VYRSPVLPISETFIRDQILALTRWRATLVGEILADPRPELEGIPLRALTNDRWGRLARGADRAVEVVFGCSPRKRWVLRSLRPDLVHVHFATDAVRLFPTVSRTEVPVVVTLHGYDIHRRAEWWRAGHDGRLMRSYPDRLLAMARHEHVHFVAVSEAIRRAALAYGLPADRLTVRHIGINTGQFARGATPPSKRAPEVLFVGRLVEKKGATYLLQAAARLRQRVPGLRVLLVGGGPEREALVAEARRLDVRAEFLGAQPHDEVRRRLGTARVLCLPSLTAQNGDAEGLPIVVLEGQAAGVPVVTSAQGGCEEGMVDEVTGFAVPERDVEQLAHRLQTLLLDGNVVDRMSASAEAFVRERFDIADCTRSLESFYDGLIGSSLRDRGARPTVRRRPDPRHPRIQANSRTRSG
jgi:glycosyltransferase involved in cell wall biosynthesis